METIKVQVQWCNRNFGASLGDNVPGAVVLTAKTFEELKKEVPETLRLHLESMEEDGDEIPAWLKNGDYVFSYDLIDTATLIKAYSELTPLVAMSKAAGINPHQLSHYATGLKTPRLAQREKIINGLHAIGRELIAVV